MLVKPTRVRSGRDRRGAAVGLVLAAMAAAATLIAIAQPGAPGGLGPNAASTREAGSLPPASDGHPTAAPDLVARAEPRSASLDARLAYAVGPGGKPVLRLMVSGWLPAQYGWATIDVVSGGRSFGGPSLRLASDGFFGDSVSLDQDVAAAGVVLRLSGLNEEQLQAVPLLSVTVSAPRPAGTTLRQPTATLPR